MRAVLAERAEGVLEGRGEAIPLPDSSVDTVFVSTAWHWFDPALAILEIARVLRDGGRLGVIWTSSDRADDRVAELDLLRLSGTYHDAWIRVRRDITHSEWTWEPSTDDPVAGPTHGPRPVRGDQGRNQAAPTTLALAIARQHAGWWCSCHRLRWLSAVAEERPGYSFGLRLSAPLSPQVNDGAGGPGHRLGLHEGRPGRWLRLRARMIGLRRAGTKTGHLLPRCGAASVPHSAAS